ncbi:Cold shock protein 1 [Linum perenne]
MAAPESKRSTGTVKWFSARKGFGFVAPDDGSEDLFVHQTAIRSEGFRTLSDGQPVEFSVDFADDGRSKAVDVAAVFKSRGGGRGGGYRRGSRGGGGRTDGSGYSYGRGSRGGGRSDGDGGSSGYSYGRGSRGGEGSGYNNGGGACYNCGRFGHLARACYQSDGGGAGGRGTRRPIRGGGGRSGVGGECYNCGEEGHFARDCVNVDRN